MPLTTNGSYPPSLNFIEAITSRDPIKDFPLLTLIEHFGADSGSFWLRDETEPTEIVLIDTFNRSDLKSKARTISIDSAGSTFERAMLAKRLDHFLYLDCGDPALSAWRSELEKNKLTPQRGKMLFLPLREKGKTELIGAVIVHSQNDFDIKSMEVNCLIHLQRVLSNILYIALEGNKEMLRQRHKIGHEVSRQINDAAGRVKQIQEAISGQRRMLSGRALDILNDAIAGLSSARDTVERETFSEAVGKRAKTCTYIDLNEVFLESSHLALADYPPSQVVFNGLIAPTEIGVKIHETDLGLLLSNLISNAAKYSVLKGDISCRWEERGKFCSLVVSNNSMELEAHDLEMMWRFGHRGPNAPDISGKGIGLSVVSDICDAYGLTPHADQSYTIAATRTNVRIDFPGTMVRVG
ncbi:ATP-binding protein [uncultured Tateyamaria sp.]|uniref:sensor histidine kinase n=1 Tax=uncultured Tateyamaria sp. TaxID=455651 RepID=UPI002617592D|nr:ATP-binding protein [uncultured Tateyamaria sp.]